MGWTVNKEIMIRNFSRCARSYDAHADVQRIAARALTRYLPESGVENILEIGCGTGIFTAYLMERFKGSRLEAIDISGSMVETARSKLQNAHIKFSVGDAEEVVPERKFDLVASNASFQWLRNVERFVSAYREALTERGALVFSVFGPLTFRELNHSLKTCLGDKPLIDSAFFLGKDRLDKILKTYFDRVMVDELVVEKSYPSLAELLRNIKYTGVRGAGANIGLIWNRGLLKRIEGFYETAYGGIKASYQIILCRADR